MKIFIHQSCIYRVGPKTLLSSRCTSIESSLISTGKKLDYSSTLEAGMLTTGEHFWLNLKLRAERQRGVHIHFSLGADEVTEIGSSWYCCFTSWLKDNTKKPSPNERNSNCTCYLRQ